MPGPTPLIKTGSTQNLTTDLRLRFSGPLRVSSLVLWEKIRMRAILMENRANYTSLERLINVDFEKKKMNCGFFNSAKENCKNDRKNDHASFNQTN